MRTSAGIAAAAACHWERAEEHFRTAIHQADADGNDATTADPTWSPLGMPGTPSMTPPFPAYISGHSTFGAAAFTVLADFYGSDRMQFSVSSDELPGVTRTFKRFSDAAAENGMSRIYMGVHWTFDNVEGKKAGGAIGDYVFNHALQRQRSHDDRGNDVTCPQTATHDSPSDTNVFSDLLVSRKADELWS